MQKVSCILFNNQLSTTSYAASILIFLGSLYQRYQALCSCFAVGWAGVACRFLGTFMIALHNVTVSYQRHPALHHVSGVIKAGSLTALVGSNGSGKSTLLKTIKGILKIEEGQVDYRGVPSPDISFMPQYHQLEFQFPVSVEELVLLGNWRRSKLFGGMPGDAQQKMLAALDAVGLTGFGARRINTLSVGQLQRALFARVMVEDAQVILLDEPFSAIDSNTSEALWRIIHHWQAQGRTLLISLHDLAQVREHCPETVLLAREVIAWGNTGHVLVPQNLARAKTMIQAWDDHATACLA